MKPRRAAYLAHRWLGILISLQLLAWSTGGFIFSTLHLEEVRGERDIAAPVFEPVSRSMIEVLPG